MDMRSEFTTVETRTSATDAEKQRFRAMRAAAREGREAILGLGDPFAEAARRAVEQDRRSS
jgi:hypothetical protein